MNIFRKEKILILKSYFKEIIYILIGSILIAYSTNSLLLPNKLSSGGFAGISTILYYFLNIPLGYTTILLNIPLLILGYLRVGKKFFIKSILGIIFLSIAFYIFDNVASVTSDKLLACIYGGILMGIGTTFILKANASTGGTELTAYIIKSFKSNYRSSSLIAIVDASIILLNVVFFKNLEIGLYSFITIYIMGKIIDVIVEGINFKKMIYIISEKSEQISKEIGSKVQRGSTGLYAKGMYENNDKLIILCVSNRSEIAKIKQIALENDKKAFVIIVNAREVLGYGFTDEK